MTREEINNICHIVHSTILSFFEPLAEKEERPFTKEELLLLSVSKAICNKIKEMPTVDRPHGEWKQMFHIIKSQQNWKYLKEHIEDMRDADGKLNQKETCQFILNLMGVIEREGDA